MKELYILIAFLLILIVIVSTKKEYFFYDVDSPTWVNFDFDIPSALFMANLSKQAYNIGENNSEIIKFAEEHFLEFNPSENTFTDINTQTSFMWLLSSNHKDMYVSFRGTELNEENIKDDIYQEMVPIPGVNYSIRVSKGFWNAASPLAKAFYDIVHYIQPQKLFVTGHSLGAAIATLAVFNLEFFSYPRKCPKPIIYTFASPRVGDPGFSVHFKELVPKSFRVEEIYDPIPRFPTTYQGYEHVETSVLLTPKSFEIGGYPPRNIPWNIKYHHINSYIENLRKFM